MTEVMRQQERKQFYRDSKGQKISSEDFDYVDTKSIQFNSVLSFLDGLGYDYFPCLNNVFIRRDLEGYKGCGIISFNLAVKLHNSSFVPTFYEGYVAPVFNFVRKMDGGYFETTFLTNAYIYEQAKSAKIVKQVFLNGGRKPVQCYKQAVEFTNPQYEALFLRPLIEKGGV